METGVIEQLRRAQDSTFLDARKALDCAGLAKRMDRPSRHAPLRRKYVDAMPALWLPEATPQRRAI